MSQESVSVVVEKEIYDVLVAVAKSLADTKAAVKSGVSGAALIASIGSALVADLAPVIAEVGSLAGDVSDSKIAAVESVLAAVPALVSAIIS